MTDNPAWDHFSRVFRNRNLLSCGGGGGSNKAKTSPAIGAQFTIWRKCEARLNALSQFITEIDGLDIHFIHVRSKHNVNGKSTRRPGSIVEQMKIIDPLTNPIHPRTAGPRSSRAFRDQKDGTRA